MVPWLTVVGAGRPNRQSVALFAAAAVGAGLVVLPIAVIVVQAVQVSPHEIVSLLGRRLVVRLIRNTLSLVAGATLISAIVGVGAAWVVERTRLPGTRAWAVLAAVPLAIPPFISSYAWVSLSEGLQDFAGALLVVTSAYFPLVYLPVAAALRGLDPALEETARALGLGPWRCFVRVVLPQLRPALFGGMVLVALNATVEFGAFSLLRYRTFTTEIFAEYRTGFAGPEAALLSAVLVFACLLLLALEGALRGRARYARVGSLTRRKARRHGLGWATMPVLLACGAVAIATVAVPTGMVLYWLTRPGAAAVSPAAVSASHLVHATIASFGLGVAAAALTVGLAVPVGLLSARRPGPFTALLERTTFLAQGVPGVVVALALVTLTVRALPPLYQSAALLVVAYSILFLPLALVSVRAAFAQVPLSLEEAARGLGLSWFAMALRVLLPASGSGLAAGAALVFVSTVTEVTATLLLAPIGTRTLATEVWADTSTLAFAAAAPSAGLMVALSLLSTWLLVRRLSMVGAAIT